MATLEASGFDSKVLAGSVSTILTATSLLSLATLMVEDGSIPWINTAYFAWDPEFNLYFLSSPKAIHSKNLLNNPKCAASIFDSQQSGEGGKAGLQVSGECHLALADNLERGLRAYQERFKGFDKVIGEVSDFDKGIIEARLFCISMQKIKIFDEASFGEEVWISSHVRRSI